MTDLQLARKLYSEYNPRYKNKELLVSYNKITGENLTEKSTIRKIYNDIIMKDYHNESVVKYHLTNYLMKWESYSIENKTKDFFDIMYEVNTNVALNENSRMSRCDTVCINRILTGIPGFEKYSSNAFEIKTEYDTLKRLPQQIKDYQKIFNNVTVVAHESKKKELFEMLKNTNVAILLYDKHIKFRILKSTDKWIEHDYQPFVNDYIQDKVIDPKQQIRTCTLSYLRKAYNLKNIDRNTLDDLIKEDLNEKETNEMFVSYLHDKYSKNWNNLKQQIAANKIQPLDYQWFFKNTIDTNLVYR